MIFFSHRKMQNFFYQREFRHEFRRVYAHATLVLAIRDDYTQLADTRELRCVLCGLYASAPLRET